MFLRMTAWTERGVAWQHLYKINFATIKVRKNFCAYGTSSVIIIRTLYVDYSTMMLSFPFITKHFYIISCCWCREKAMQQMVYTSTLVMHAKPFLAYKTTHKWQFIKFNHKFLRIYELLSCLWCDKKLWTVEVLIPYCTVISNHIIKHWPLYKERMIVISCTPNWLPQQQTRH